MRWIIIHTLVILFILILGLSPLISATVAGSIAEANGCVLHEGFKNPCMIDGVDRGGDLYTAFVIGWAAIATVPIALGIAAVYLVIVIIVSLVQASCRRKAAATATLPPN
jgi:hypothetical protein